MPGQALAAYSPAHASPDRDPERALRRRAAQLLATFAVALAVLAADDAPARAALVWEQSGPAAAEALTAVTTDPGDPRVVWVAGGRNVWVSDDAGDSWNLVLLIAQGTRERVEEVDDGLALDDGDRRDDGDDEDEEGFEDGDSFDDEALLEAGRDTLEGQVGEGGEDGEEGLGSDAAESLEEAMARADAPGVLEARLGSEIVRLRVIGDSVYVAAGRGLWVIDRAARTLGSGQEVRFGRQVAVLDVAPRVEGGLWLATTRGLLVVEPNGMAVPAQGQLGNDPIRALLPLPDGLRVAAPDDVWTSSDSGFVPSGLTLSSGAVVDMVPAPGADYAAAATTEVFVVARTEAGAPTVAASWPVPPVARVGVGRDGDLWAVGSSGVWRRTAEGAGWEPRMEGLPQGQLADVAVAREGVAWMWVVGARGAYRLITERDRVWSRRARALAGQAVKGVPTVTDVFEAAARHRRVDLEGVGAFRIQKGLSFLLPDVQLRVREVRMRDESRPFALVLGSRITQEVRIVPLRDEVRIEAEWDLYPALTALMGLEPEGGLEFTREYDRRRRARERLRESLAPLYNEWLRLRVLASVSASAEGRQAVRERLILEQLEADLYAITGGWFSPPPLDSAPDDPGDAP